MVVIADLPLTDRTSTACASLPVSPAHKPKVRRPSLLGIKPVTQTSARGSETSGVPTVTSPGVSENYYKEIRDHDYCSNVPLRIGGSSQRRPSRQTNVEVPAVIDEKVNPEGSMLKNLLVDSQLMAKMKQETFERRNSAANGAVSRAQPSVILEEDQETSISTTRGGMVEQEGISGVRSAGDIDSGTSPDVDKPTSKDTRKFVGANGTKEVSVPKVRSSRSSSTLAAGGPGPSVVPTLKKTFTLDELISKNMKHKALEKAQLEAILKTTPRSTPRSSPCQSPRKSDSPKLPELPGIMGLAKSPSKKVTPTKKCSSGKLTGSKRKPGVLENHAPEVAYPQKRREAVKVSAASGESKTTRPQMDENGTVTMGEAFDVPKPDGKSSRIRTQSKCLDVVDMEVDETDDVCDTEAFESLSSGRETPDGKPNKVAEAVPNVVPASVNCKDDGQTGDKLAVEEVLRSVEVPTDETLIQQKEHSAKDKNTAETESCVKKNFTGKTQSPSNDSEDGLYEEAMDIHVPPTEDPFVNFENVDPFEPAIDRNDLHSTDLNDNLQTPVPTRKFPFVTDPLGLESGEPVSPLVADQARSSAKENQEKPKTSNRNYRKRNERASPEREPAVFDKLPSYCKSLTVPNKYPQKSEINASKLVDHSIPDRDRDPSPDRADSAYSKLPSYVSNFANSTKYDAWHDPWASKTSSTSRPTSRHVSRESTPKAYQRSRSASSSSSCSSSSSSSTSRSRSRDTSGKRSRGRSGCTQRRRAACRSGSGGSNRSR